MLAKKLSDGFSLSPAVSPEETFCETWPFKANYIESVGFPMHYVTEDAPAEVTELVLNFLSKH